MRYTRVLARVAISAGVAGAALGIETRSSADSDGGAGRLPGCPGDCDGDAVVGIADFLALLEAWGPCPGCCHDTDGDGTVGIGDFLELLGGWGPCPAPPNDECVGRTLIDRADPDGVTTVAVDLRGTTSSPDQQYCLVFPDPKDAWWCLTNAAGDPKLVRIKTSINVIVEVYDGCACSPPGALITCGFGLQGTEQAFPMPPGGQVTIRLMDHLMLPDEDLVGTMDVINLPVTPPG